MEPDSPGIAAWLIGAVPHAEAAVVDAHAVWADQEQAGLARHLRDLLLNRDTVLGLRLREARSEERNRADFLFDAVGYDAGSNRPRHGADDVIDEKVGAVALFTSG